MLRLHAASVRPDAGFLGGPADRPNNLLPSIKSIRCFDETRRCDISSLRLVAFSIAAPALPAHRGRLHRAARSPRLPPPSRRASSSPPGSGCSSVPLASRATLAAGTRTSRVAKRLGERDVAGQAQAQLAAPLSSTAGWSEPIIPRSALRRTEEEW
jgi:hypothetical protein